MFHVVHVAEAWSPLQGTRGTGTASYLSERRVLVSSRFPQQEARPGLSKTVVVGWWRTERTRENHARKSSVNDAAYFLSLFGFNVLLFGHNSLLVSAFSDSTRWRVHSYYGDA